eukprot:CAMPEP_0185039480 /NCGR_PEP_ID=MMETSP1103-20130426/36376_1 /TAXON_ID=36769 /ORGANISM="Paraphysomonas bandaiensis, Strain Caron Lab Isolate" /LENGTH=372 /DNA_ID=CAMNT_0027578383 /DNA_START=71 /DNA_END=1186 /DNA_ORIENTATION=-
MGGIVAPQVVYEEDVPEIDMKCYEEEYSILGLKRKQILQLYSVFKDICSDSDCSAAISVNDILHNYFGVENNTFTAAIFTSFDVDLYTVHDIDFARFLQAMWNYCTLDDTGLCACIFNLYDKHDEGYIHKRDICGMLTDLYGTDFENCEEAQITRKEIEENRRRHVDYDNFEKLAGIYPALLYPAFVYQHVLREKVLGEKFWKPLETYRLQQMPSKEIKYVPVRVLLMSRTDRLAIKRYIENREQISAMKIATLRSMGSMKLTRDGRGSQSDVETSTNPPSTPPSAAQKRFNSPHAHKHPSMNGTLLSSMYRGMKRSLSGVEKEKLSFDFKPARTRLLGDGTISETKENGDESTVDVSKTSTSFGLKYQYIW